MCEDIIGLCGMKGLSVPVVNGSSRTDRFGLRFGNDIHRFRTFISSIKIDLETMISAEIEIQLDVISPAISTDRMGLNHRSSIFDYDGFTRRIAVIDTQRNVVFLFTGYKIRFECLRHRINHRRERHFDICFLDRTDVIGALVAFHRKNMLLTIISEVLQSSGKCFYIGERSNRLFGFLYSIPQEMQFRTTQICVGA